MRDLKAGPASIPRTADELVTWLQHSNETNLAEQMATLEEVYINASESKKGLDTTIQGVHTAHSHILKHLHFGLNWIKIDAYDVLEEAMMKMECSPETSFFDGLMNKLAAEEGVSHKILEVFRGIEDSIKGRATMTNDDLRHIAEEAVAIRDEITGMLSSESGVRRDVLDLLNSRIEILQNKRQPLSGEEIAFRCSFRPPTILL